jgi:hypothetical protein
VLLAAADPSPAASVLLKIRAINPSQTERQKVEVKAYLPKPATPDDVIRRGDLEISYDHPTQSYYVHGETELDPGENRTYEVELQDIWLLREETLDTLGAHAQSLADAVRGTEQGAPAARVRETVEAALRTVRERQKAYDVTLARPADHIRAYESNLETLTQVRKDIGLLENLALEAGRDPEKIMGIPRVVPVRPDAGSESAEGVTNLVLFRVRVTNPSLTTRRTVPVKRDLPREIRPLDVADAGGMQVGFDAGRGVTYVYLEGVELGPQESRLFDIRVRDRWAATRLRVTALRTQTTNLLTLAERTAAYKSIEDEARAVLAELTDIQGQESPPAPGDEYVAFHRRMAARLDEAQTRVVRLEELFQPRQKPQNIFGAPILNVRPPSSRTTWIIIYIILGFLLVVSLLFFLRWYGKSRAERYDSGGPTLGPEAPGKSGRRPRTEAPRPGHTPAE